MDYATLLEYLRTSWPKRSLREPVRAYPFDRLRQLLTQLGSPEQQGTFVGITGSKGKGSIARLLADILRAHGLRVGLFTSPHLVRVEERAELDGQLLPPEEFARRFGEILSVQRASGLEELGVTPLFLALALSWFREAGADVAVLEVRAGGRFDPIAVAAPDPVCIGPIDLEHVPGLGYTRADIAWQKVGLVRPGGVAFSARQGTEAAAVIERECRALGATLYAVGRDLDYEILERAPTGQLVTLRGLRARYPRLPLGLLGAHQAANATLALGAAEVLLERQGRRLDHAALARALGAARWPARLERLSDAPLVLYDGAHTPDAAAALARALDDHFPGRRWSLVVGVTGDREPAGLLRPLAPRAARVRGVPVPEFSHQPPERIAEIGRRLGLDAAPRPSLAAALEELARKPEPICATGTLYLYAATLQALGR